MNTLDPKAISPGNLFRFEPHSATSCTFFMYSYYTRLFGALFNNENNIVLNPGSNWATIINGQDQAWDDISKHVGFGLAWAELASIDQCNKCLKYLTLDLHTSKVFFFAESDNSYTVSCGTPILQQVPQPRSSNGSHPCIGKLGVLSSGSSSLIHLTLQT